MKDKAKLLRNELKALGLTSQDVSVRVKPCTYSERMDVIIKNLSIDIREIERLARKYEIPLASISISQVVPCRVKVD